VHHDLVLVAGFSQRKERVAALRLVSAAQRAGAAMRQHSRVAIIVFGAGSAVATVYWRDCSRRYRRGGRSQTPAPSAALASMSGE